MPGGKNDAGEDFLDTAVRELEEETGLKADRTDARLLALLMDYVHGVPRLTRRPSASRPTPANRPSPSRT
ncbi:NUDIX domain-containing protein [Streptomyces echinoruber]|uniref:NUDIX domain-containing protein n=1 Tax=Streptomyces echinoruber TaxID=68898 RepID=UPI001E424952|nr:NUDIX domain-containing protein [Streptomyces echinoruber]